MKKFISLVLALVMALSLTTVAWGANVLEVGAGKPYATIQDAVNDANPGDTIKVAAGTYDAFYIPADKDGLTIEGTVEGGVLKTIVRTLYDTSPTFESNRCGGINVDAANITLKNLAIQSDGYTNGRWYAAPIGHYYENTSDRSGLTVEGCTITNMAASKSGIAICVNIADITLEKNVITGYDTGWRAESGLNLDTVVVEGNTFNVNSCAVEFVNSGTPETVASVSITGNNFNGGDVIIWDYANTKDYIDSAIENVTLSGNTYGAGSDVILYDFEGGQADDEITSDKAPVETYGTLANAVRLNPDATEVTLHYGTASEVTYTEQSNGTWLDDNGTEYDRTGSTSRSVVAKIGNTTYETLAAAVAAAQAGDTIVLLANTAENVTVSENVTIVPNGKTTGTVSAGTNYNVIKTNGVYVVVAKTSAAGTTTTLKNTDKYDIYEITGTTSVKVAANADLTKKVTDKTTVTVGNKSTVTYTATTYSDDANVYVEVDSTVATHKLTQNGAVVAYMVNLADVGYVPTTTKTVTSYVAAVEKATCGQYSKTAYPAGVYMIDGKAYAAGGANWALYNGKFVNYGGEATAVPHTYAVNTYNTTDKSVATLKCSVCKQVFTVLTPAQVKPLAPASYAQVTVDGNNYFIAVAAVSAGTATDTKVESAETFDAGIALYVGMSVMAATGAVVLKKKD